MNTEIFEDIESNVRSYSRKYPTIFSRAKNAEMYDVNGNRYIDFLAVAGSMNFGHNNNIIKGAVLEYLKDDNIINSLDMYTVAKERFLRIFNEYVLKPQKHNYKVMFCGPTGTNSVEAALKLARKVTGRNNVVAFGGGYHGMSLGSLAVTTDRASRFASTALLGDVTFIPFENTGSMNSIDYLNWIIEDDHSGIEKPAAIILETVQAEGGVNVASEGWLKKISWWCRENEVLLIIDDIQVGVGRTGPFFSFDRAGITPDMITLSKSISGFGLPMSILLIKPEYDAYKPAEHNGTFRGNNLAFVGGARAIQYFFDESIEELVYKKGKYISEYIKREILPIDESIDYRGTGMIWGIDLKNTRSGMARRCIDEAFSNGLIIETAGRGDDVIKIIPPLTIEDDVLAEGLQILKQSISKSYFRFD